MAKLIILLNLLFASAILAKPAKEALDKATATDIVVNSVNPENPVAANTEEKPTIILADPNNSSSNILLSDVSFGTPTTNVKRPGAGVARIIDDIFQIPIGVLQSVARLLRNPFISHKTPETVSSY